MEKLLVGVAVEWKALGEVGEFLRGKRFVKADMVSEGFPCIHYGELYTHYGIWAKQAKSFLKDELASKLRVASHGDVVIVAAGETIEDIGKGTAWLGKTDVVIHDACFSYKSTLNPKYVSYFLRTKQFHDQIKKHVSSGKISSIHSNGLGKALIPIPSPDNPEKSIEIQCEIVRILDTFTKLTAELTAELTARKKQYTYYRNQLLTFEDGQVEWKALGDISDIYGGLTGKSKADFENGNASYITYKNIFNNIEVNFEKLESVKVSDSENQHEVKYGDVLFTGSSETAEDAGMSSAVTTEFEGSVYLNSFSFGVRFYEDIKLIPEFSKYLFRSHFMRSGIAKTASGVTRFNISKARFKKILIPIPPREIQSEIVAILDKFDALTNSITEGLPREIEQRQKQYDYYREMLLSFPKAEVEA